MSKENAFEQLKTVFDYGKKLVDDPEKTKKVVILGFGIVILGIILFCVFYFTDIGKQDSDKKDSDKQDSDKQDSDNKKDTDTTLVDNSSSSTVIVNDKDHYATSPNELLRNGISKNGIYYMDIGDGRGVKQYYVNFTLKGGPYVLVAQNMYNEVGIRAMFGVQNVNEPVEDVTKNNNIMPPNNYHFNTNIVTKPIPINRYMVMNCNDANNNYTYTYIYFNLDNDSRNKYYQELSDFNGKIWGNSTNTSIPKPLPNTYIGKTTGEIITLNNPTISTSTNTSLKNWNSTDTMIEQHYNAWNSTNRINYIMEVGKSTRNNGLGQDKSVLGFGSQGRSIMISNNSSFIEGNYDWHFINF